MNARPEDVTTSYSQTERKNDWSRLTAVYTLRKVLEDHPDGVPRSDIVTLARETGIEWGLMWKVAAVLGVERRKLIWQLPACGRDD